MKILQMTEDAKATHEYMAVGNNAWGRGATWEEAKKQMKKQTGGRVRACFIVPKGARLDDISGTRIQWNANKDAGDHGRDRCEHCQF